jgi:hypothetical protein
MQTTRLKQGVEEDRMQREALLTVRVTLAGDHTLSTGLAALEVTQCIRNEKRTGGGVVRYIAQHIMLEDALRGCKNPNRSSVDNLSAFSNRHAPEAISSSPEAFQQEIELSISSNAVAPEIFPPYTIFSEHHVSSILQTNRCSLRL